MIQDLNSLIEKTHQCKTYQDIIDAIGVDEIKQTIRMGCAKQIQGIVASVCNKQGIPFNKEDPLWSENDIRTEEETRALEEKIKKAERRRLAFQNWIEGNTDQLDLS